MSSQYDIINKYYPDNITHSYLPPDILSLCVSYVAKKHTSYHPNGQKRCEGVYYTDKGIKHGEWCEWDRDGRLICRENWNMDTRVGPREKWTHQNDKTVKIIDENWVNGNLNGLCIYKNAQGIHIRHTNYDNGKRHGEEETWYECGNTSSRSIWRNGIPVFICQMKRNGTVSYFYDETMK